MNSFTKIFLDPGAAHSAGGTMENDSWLQWSYLLPPFPCEAEDVEVSSVTRFLNAPLLVNEGTGTLLCQVHILPITPLYNWPAELWISVEMCFYCHMQFGSFVCFQKDKHREENHRNICQVLSFFFLLFPCWMAQVPGSSPGMTPWPLPLITGYTFLEQGRVEDSVGSGAKPA